MTRAINPLNEEFSLLVADTMNKWHVPGISIGIVSGDDAFMESYGFAKLPDEKMRTGTLMHVASLTKAFTAGMCTLLVDDTADDPGPIKWDTPLNSKIRGDFVLQSEYATNHITLEDALSHRSGMPRHDLSLGTGSSTYGDSVRNFRNLPLTAELRSKYQYSNIMYLAVGHFIESVTKLTLQDAFVQRIWKPLGMKTTFLKREDAEKAVDSGLAPRIATGYAWDCAHGEFVAYPDTDYAEISPAGGVLSTVEDFTKWLRCLISKSSPLSPEGHAAMRVPRSHVATASREPFGGPQLYSLGLRQTVYRGYQIFWHGGDLLGYGTHLCFIPDLKWGVIMMANSQASANYAEQILTFGLIDDLLDITPECRYDWTARFEKIILEYRDHIRTAKLRLYPESPVSRLSTTLPLAAYAGSYFNKGYRNITIGLSTNQPQTLQADCLDRQLPFILCFTHVNGDFFLVHVKQPKDRADREWFVFEDFAIKARFRLDSRGTVEEVGLGLETGMGDELLWFRKV